MTEITRGRKKYYFHRIIPPSHQASDEFDLFVDRLQSTVDLIKSLKPPCIVITGDFNCRIKQLPGDVELPERSGLDEFIERNNLSQLIDEPTNIRTTGMSSTDLITNPTYLSILEFILPQTTTASTKLFTANLTYRVHFPHHTKVKSIIV